MAAAPVAVGGTGRGGGGTGEQAGAERRDQRPAAPSPAGCGRGRRQGQGEVPDVQAWGTPCPLRSTGVVARWSGARLIRAPAGPAGCAPRAVLERTRP